MFSKFLPQQTNFFELFDKHAEITVKSARAFHALAYAQDSVSGAADQIKGLELEADNVVHRCGEMLHKTFITPIDREDIMRLVSSMDNIVDFIDAAADCIVVYKVEGMKSAARDLAELVLACCIEVQKAVKALSDMKQADAIRAHCMRINQLENDADLVLRNALGRLFDEEPDARVIIKWKEIFENLERATDCCEDVADALEGIVLEYD
jgi:uncharacterized protein